MDEIKTEVFAVSPAPVVPDTLSERNQWVAWNYEDSRKVPCDVSTGLHADITNPGVLVSFREVTEALKREPGRYAGCGFVFTEADDLVGIDIDDCLDEQGELKSWARPIIEKLDSTYIEISPSGVGLKAFVHGALDRNIIFKLGDGQIEVYARDRYFTVTGHAWRNAPLEIDHHQFVIDQLFEMAEQVNKPRKVNEHTATAGAIQFVSSIQNYVAKVIQDECAAIQVAQFGEQNTVLNRSAYAIGTLAEHVDRGDAMEEMVSAGLKMPNQPGRQPWKERQIRNIVRDGFNSGAVHPRRIAERPTENRALVPQQTSGSASIHWRSQLISTANGTPKALLANSLIALRLAVEMRGVLAYDELSLSVTLKGETPWGSTPKLAWDDNQDRLVAEWLQHQGIHVSVEIAAQAVQTVAQENPFHPIREYLGSLLWDGTPRVATWLRDYLGVGDSDYSRAVGQCWLISAIARALDAGVKADCCMILEGSQGLGKSTSLRILGGRWFTDEIADLGSKDAALQTRGAWIIELAELDSMSRGEVGRIKAFMSRSTDRFRPPYGRRLIESPRQCVFAGSVNHGVYLRDETGGRRFWPVACQKVETQKLEHDRDQLWAEAVQLYRAKTPWWLDTAELVDVATQEQLARYDGDPWEEKIATWIENREDVSIGEILSDRFDKTMGTWSQSEANRVARCLRSLAWERFRSRAGTGREWRYRHVSR